MKLSELKESVEENLKEIGDAEVFVIYKNPFTGAIIQDAKDVVIAKMKREDKKPFVCFALSACTFEECEKGDPEDIKDMFKDCTTEL